MAIARTQIREQTVQAQAASASSILEFYFPRPARLKRLFAVPSVAEAAHATQVLSVVAVNAGTDGSGSTTIGTLTNDTDVEDSIIIESSAWVAHDAKELNYEARPASPTNAENEAYEIAAGTVIKVTVAKGAGTTTGNVLVGLEVIESD